MKLKLALAGALGALALASPALADPPRGDDYGRGYSYGYNQHADFDRDYGQGYRGDATMLRDREQRLGFQIREGMNEGWLNRFEAGSAWNELRAIRFQTEREIGVHGLSLPDDDRRRILFRIERLSHFLSDQERGGDNWGRGNDRGFEPGYRH